VTRRQTGLWGALAALVVTLLALALVHRFLPQGRDVTGFADPVDGDSLRLAGREVRLRGIDAPELRQTCRRDGGEWPCGREALMALDRKIGLQPIACTPSGRDRFGRDLADCRVGETHLNAWLVREGWAVAFGAFAAEEGEARAARRGIWAGSFESPSAWRAKNPRPDRR
jgi:endonuclease YncB( thermonuclease family)